MYKIIGVDGQQYGPVAAGDLRRWLAENRINAHTQVQAEGAAEWKPLSAFPEFADVLKASPPLLTDPPSRINTEALAAEILAADVQVDIGSCFSRSWDLLARHFWVMVGASFVLGLIEGAIGLLAGVCMGGFYYLLLKLIRGERAQFGDAFCGFSLAFLQLFLAGLISSLLTSLGLLFCLLPGIYLAVAWIFALPLVIDKKLDFWSAMELSRRVVTRHWWLFLGLLLLNFVVLFLGFLVCIVGLLIAQPVVYGAIAYAYEDLFGRQAAGSVAGRATNS